MRLGNWQAYTFETVRDMLEAVNAALQAAPILRVNAEQSSTAESFAANPDRIQKVSQAPYLSPYYSIDAVKSTVILQIRDPQTGKVLQSYPSETDLETAQHNEPKEAQATVPQTLASDASVQVYAQVAADAEPQAAKAAAPTGQQIAAFSSAASSGQPSVASVSVLA